MLGADLSSSESGGEDEADGEADPGEVDGEVVAPPLSVVAEVIKAAESDGPTKRQYDTSVRDQVRGYFMIKGDGSYERGGTFVCVFCKKRKYNWNTQFNVTIAKSHLVSQCEACPPEVEAWVRENHSSTNGYFNMKRKKARSGNSLKDPPAPIQDAAAGGGASSVASSQQ